MVDESGPDSKADARRGDVALAKARSASAGVKKAPWWVAPAIGVAIFAVLAPLGVSLTLGIVTTLTTVLFYMIIAQGWNLLGGYGGYLNFGASVFAGAGAYTAGWMNTQFGSSIWMTILPGALAAVLISLVVGYATLRLRSHYFAIFTLVLTFLGMVIVENWSALGGATGLYLFLDGDWTSRSMAEFFYYVMLVFAVIATVVAAVVENTNFGYALRAISEDEIAAQVLGVKTTAVKLRALMIGAAFGGIAGSIYAFMLGYIEPRGQFSLDVALDIVLVCVIGGMRSWLGPVIGSIIVVSLEQLLRVVLPGMSLFGASVPAETNRLVLGVLLIVFALFIRRGVVGLFSKRRGRQLTV